MKKIIFLVCSIYAIIIIPFMTMTSCEAPYIQNKSNKITSEKEDSTTDTVASSSISFCYSIRYGNTPYVIIEIKDITNEKLIQQAVSQSTREMTKIKCKLIAEFFTHRETGRTMKHLPTVGEDFEMYFTQDMCDELKTGDIIIAPLTYTSSKAQNIQILTEPDTGVAFYIPFVNGSALFDNNIWETVCFKDFSDHVHKSIKYNKIIIDNKDTPLKEKEALSAAPTEEFKSGMTLEESIEYFNKVAHAEYLLNKYYLNG